MEHGGRLLLALLIGIGLAALGRVVYAQNSGYVFYIPTSTAPVGHSVPVTLPSGYAFVTSAAQLFYPFTQPTTNTTGVSTFTKIYGIATTSSTYSYGTIWNYSNPVTYNGWLVGGTVAYNQSAITSSSRLTNFVYVAYFTTTASSTSGMNIKMTVVTSGISINCISSLIVNASNTFTVYTITNTTTNAAAGSVFEVNWGPSNIALSSSNRYVIFYICYATGYVSGVTVNYGSGFTINAPNLHVDSGYRVDLAYFYFPALVTVSNSVSGAWVALQFRNYWTKLQVANVTGSSYVYRAVASPSFYSMYAISNTGLTPYASPSGSFTVNFIYLNAASGSLNSGTVSNVKAYLGTSSSSLAASSSLGSMSSLTLNTVPFFGVNYTASPPANTTLTTMAYCYYTVASSGVTWNCPPVVNSYSTVYISNQAGASTLYLAISETLPGSPASYGYLNSTNPFPSGNVTSFPTSGSYSAYYIAGSTSATAIPIAKGLTVWQTTLPCTLGSALTSVALSENKPSSSSPPVFVQPTINGTVLRTWLTSNLTFYTCVPSGDQEQFGVTPTQVNTIALQFNGVNQYFQLSQCTITSNPYSGGNTGTYGLLNCIAIQNGAISAVVWFYEPPGGVGTLLSFQTVSYPNTPELGWTPMIYIGTNGQLYMGDCCNVATVSASVSPGWHIAVFEEWASSTTGPYYIAGYLDGKYLGQQQLSSIGSIFGIRFGPYLYNYIGTGYTYGWPAGNGGWFFFNGAIALVALYPFVLSSSQVALIENGILPPGYVALYIGFTYNPSSQVWVDASGHGYNAQGYNGPLNTVSVINNAPYLFNLYSNTYTYTIPSTAHSTTLNIPAYLPYLGQAFYVNTTYTPIYVTLNPYVYGGSTPVSAMGNIVVEPSGYASTTISTPLVTSPWSIYLGSMFKSVTVTLPNEWFTNANTGGVGHVSFTIGSGLLGSVFGPLLTANSNVNVTYVGMWQYSSSLVNNLGVVNFVQPNGALQRVVSLTTNYGSFPLNTSGVSIMLVNQTTTVTSITSAGTVNTAWYPGVGSYSLTPGATWYLVQATSPYGYVGPPMFKTSLPSIWYIQPSYGSGFTTASNALVKVFNLTSGALLTSANFGSFQYLYLYPNIWGVYINATEIFPNLLPTYNVTGFYMTTVPKSPVNLFVTVTQTAQSQWSGQVLTGLINDYSGNWLWLNGTLYAGIVAGQYSVDTFDVPANLVNTPTGFVFYDPGTGSEASLVTNLDPSTYITLGTFGNTLIKTLYTIGYTANAPQPPPLIAPPPNALLSLGETGFGQLVLTGAIAAVGIYIMSRVKSASIGIIIVGALTLGIGALLGAASMLAIGIIMMAGGIAYRYVKGQ